jgi:hypothetical protein
MGMEIRIVANGTNATIVPKKLWPNPCPSKYGCITKGRVLDSRATTPICAHWMAERCVRWRVKYQ